MNKIHAAVPIVACALVVTQCSGSWKPQEMEPVKVERTFRVTGVNMCSPEGFFILVRRDRDLTALKFFNARKGGQAGTGVAHYIAYVPAGHGGDFRGRFQKQEGSVSVKGWSGFHPFVAQHGDYKIKIGPFRLTYDFPTCLWLGDTSAEYAPTPWTRIEDVDASAAQLRWFRYDASGELSLEILPEDIHATSPKPK